MRRKGWHQLASILLAMVLVVHTLLPAAVSAETSTQAQADNLIISEYVEGSSLNKAIELYNGTGSSIDLSAYSLELYSNGNTEPQSTLELEGSIEHEDTYVLYNGQAAQAIQDVGDQEASGIVNFNGDDALALKKDNEIIDSFGQFGEQIENAKDVTLVRNSEVTSGDAIADDPFDPQEEWTAYETDTFEHLGTHSMTGVPSDHPPAEDTPPEEGKDEEATEPVSIAEAREQGEGEVIVQGTVTAVLTNTIHIQDQTAAIAIHPVQSSVQPGDTITVKGNLGEYNNLLQLQNPQILENADAQDVPEPIELTGDQLNEENESKLATVHNVTLTGVEDGGSWANYNAADGNGDFLVRDESANLNLSEEQTYDSITGVVQQYGEDYQIIPRSKADIIQDDSVAQPVTAVPEAGVIPSGSVVELSTTTDNATIYYTIDGSEPTENSQVYTEPIVVNEDMTIRAVAVAEGLESSQIADFSYTVFDQEEGLQIHDIQGASHTSDLDGRYVDDITGVVTYEYSLNGNEYFHIQTPDHLTDDNPKTSEGLIVFTGNQVADVEVGDMVEVTGTVDEFYIDGFGDRQETDLPVTQINARNDQGGEIEMVEEGVELPNPITINSDNLPREVIDNDSFTAFDPQEDAIDFWEALEGMRVEVGTVKAVALQEHGDIITVLENRETDTMNGGVRLQEDDANADRVQFKLHDNGEARDFDVTTGDTFTGPITGVVNYGYQNYKIYADLEDMQAAHNEGDTVPEKNEIDPQENELTIASYNLENFSNNENETSDAKAAQLAEQFVEDMNSPDIIGVTEVQDNNGEQPGPDNAQANESYERLIDEIVDAGGPEYEYVNIDPVYNADGGAPNANIRVGFLYNPDRVSLPTDENGNALPEGDATTAVGYEDGQLTHNPGRIDPQNGAFADSRKPLAAQFNFQGEDVIVIVNHWNSKGGDTPLFGSTQPPVYGSEEQRVEIAQVVYDFISEVKAENPDANIVSVGDFNDFQWTDALQIHEGDLMTNMIYQLEPEERYTYLYQGNSQILDHALVSNNLVDQTEIDIVHANSDFTEMGGRASDHDPVMIQLDLDEGEESESPEPITPDETYHFSDYKTGKLIVQGPSVSITLDANTDIKNGVEFKGNYAEFHGDGFADTTVTIKPKPKNAGAIVDFKGTEIGQVIIETDMVTEIRGAENIQDIEFENGANPNNIKIAD